MNKYETNEIVTTTGSNGKIISWKATGDEQKDAAIEIQILEAIECLDWKYGITNIENQTVDCSGLTAHLYEIVGTEIPRSSHSNGERAPGQYDSSNGTQVFNHSINDVDLIDWDSVPTGSILTFGSNGGHVGYYLGNGYFIHALSGKYDIVISSIYDRSDDIKKSNGKFYTSTGMEVISDRAYLSWDDTQKPLCYITTFEDNIYVDKDGNIFRPEMFEDKKLIPTGVMYGDNQEILYIDSDGKYYIKANDKITSVSESVDAGAGLNGMGDEIDINNEFISFLKNIKSSFESASHVRYDPIMLDLDGDGFNIETKENGTNFDLDNNGFAEKINWTRKDGFLCLDLNGNGVIDNGGELFGDNTLLADGIKAPNGFEALAQYDSNGDGIIDKNDAVFDSLRIWVDSDGNGISSEGELKSLSELGIIGIRLDYTELNGETGTEAILGNGASFIREDGTEGAAAELWVSADLYDTTETIDVEISEEIAKLPDVRSIGNAYSLHTALALDETGTLKGFVETFINSKSSAEKWQAVDNILYFICGAENIDSESKGGIIDAKQLAVLETMLGEKFVGMNGENPNAAAAPILEEAYRNIAEMYYSSLCIQTSIKDYAALLRYTKNEDGTKALNADLLNLVMDYELSNGSTEFNQKLYDLAIYVKQLDNCGINGLDAFIIHYAGISYDYAEMMTEIISNGYKANGISNLNGTTNADLLLGSESSEIIKGNAGNDIIIGGKGDDTLYGGAGDDTYIFNIGDGNDIISEEGYNSSNDTVRFGEGITADDITISRSIHDMVISYSENDSVTLSNVYSNSKYWVNNIEFADGTRLSIEDLFERSLTISGSGKITDFTSGFGNRGSTIIGSETADQIYGYDGNDTIIGGNGDDILYGGAGDDTYIFNIGDGNDIINEQGYGSSNDTVLFGEGISVNDIQFSKSGNDLAISFAGSDDLLTIISQFSNSKYAVENFTTSDGYSISSNQIDLLIQAMASFEADSGMTWNEAVENNDKRAADIINEMWIKTA